MNRLLRSIKTRSGVCLFVFWLHESTTNSHTLQTPMFISFTNPISSLCDVSGISQTTEAQSLWRFFPDLTSFAQWWEQRGLRTHTGLGTIISWFLLIILRKYTGLGTIILSVSTDHSLLATELTTLREKQHLTFNEKKYPNEQTLEEIGKTTALSLVILCMCFWELNPAPLD